MLLLRITLPCANGVGWLIETLKQSNIQEISSTSEKEPFNFFDILNPLFVTFTDCLNSSSLSVHLY